MQAIIKTGGKQYVVSEGDVISVEKLPENAAVESLLTFEEGKAPKTGGTVKASVVSNDKGDKIVVFKMKAKKRYRRTMGHRQQQTQLKIDKITA